MSGCQERPAKTLRKDKLHRQNFSLFREASALLIGLWTDWIRLIQIIEINLTYLKPSDYWLCVVLGLVAQLCPTLCDPMDCSPPGSSVLRDSPGKNTRLGCHALLQGIFPIQGFNPGLLHCRQILYHLSHHGSPRILERVANSFSRGTSSPRNQTGVSCIAGGFFISWATREAQLPTLITSIKYLHSNVFE